jgi:hypothetical protein
MRGKIHRTPLAAIISGLIGIIIFLVILILFKVIADHIASPFFSGFVDLLYANAALIIIFSILFMVAEVFSALDYPLNLPFPVFSAIGSVLLVSFIIRILAFFDLYFALGIGQVLILLKVILYPLTFLVVLITGYVSIFSKPGGDLPDEQPVYSESGQTPGPAGVPSWDDIGREFRQMLHDLFRRIRDEIKQK